MTQGSSVMAGGQEAASPPLKQTVVVQIPRTIDLLEQRGTTTCNSAVVANKFVSFLKLHAR